MAHLTEGVLMVSGQLNACVRDQSGVVQATAAGVAPVVECAAPALRRGRHLLGRELSSLNPRHGIEPVRQEKKAR
jgi:hypothetical protein